MAISSGHEHMGMSRESERVSTGVAAGGSVTAAICGIGAIVLCILGLIGVYPGMFAAISTIVIGAALLLEGGAIAARLSQATADLSHRTDTEIVSEGMAVESLGGLVGIILGVLALIGVAPFVLMPCATIIFGAALLMESGVNARLNNMTYPYPTPTPGQAGNEPNWRENQASWRAAHEAVAASAGSEVLFGLSGIVLGILALIGYVPLVLVLVSFLSYGCAVLLSGSAVTGKVISAFNR